MPTSRCPPTDASSLRAAPGSASSPTPPVASFTRWFDFLDDEVAIAHDGKALRAWRFPEFEPIEIAQPKLIADGLPDATEWITAAALASDRKSIALAVDDRVEMFRIERE